MFASTTQTFTFFFVSEITLARTQSVKESAPLPPTPTAPVRVKWVSAP